MGWNGSSEPATGAERVTQRGGERQLEGGRADFAFLD
jgi:hypothetical protein